MNRFLFTLLLLPFAALAAPKAKAPEPVPAPTPAPPPVDPEAWRATRPGPGPAPAFVPPEVQEKKLANGIPVLYSKNDALPIVTVRLHMNIGREANPANKGGLGSLMANLLDEGTESYSPLELAAAVQGLGANISINAGAEGIDIVLDALSEYLGLSLDLLAEVALRPAFKGAEFKRVHAETLATLESEATNPQSQLREAALGQLFGPTHPYGVPVRGTLASVKSLKNSDVKKLYKSWWHAGNASMVVVGGVDAAAVMTELDTRFGGWVSGTTTRPVVAPPAPLLKTRVVFVESPGSVQSMIGVYTPGLARNSSDWNAANLAATIVGGMFSSPLNMVLREEKGWSYGAYGGFTETRDHGMLSFRTSVQADKTAPAVTEILKVLGGAASTPPDATILTMAKDYLSKSIPGAFETNSNTAASLASLATFGLPATTWTSYQREVEAVTQAQVASMSNRFLRAEAQLLVVVGPATIEGINNRDELKALGYEFVEVKP